MKWYKRDPDAALAGMIGLTLEERAIYNTVIDLLYSRDGDLPTEDEFFARACGCRPQLWRRVRDSLIAKGKLHYKTDGKLTANRVENELKTASKLILKKPVSDRKPNDNKAPSDIACARHPQPHPEDDDADDARSSLPKSEPLIPPEAFAIAEQIGAIAKIDRDFLPPGWCGAPMLVSKWLREGWPREAIVIAVQKAMARKRDGPPSDPIYFEKPIAAEVARQAAPLPTVKISNAQEVTIGGQNGTHRGRGGAIRNRIELARRSGAAGGNADRGSGSPAAIVLAPNGS